MTRIAANADAMSIVPGKPSRMRLWLLSLVLLFMAAGLVFSGIGGWLAAPASNPQQADVVVVLGGDGGVGRTIRAGELIRGGYAPQALLTGNCTGSTASLDKLCATRLEVLAEMGVATSLLSFDTGSRNSWEEAISTRRLMDEKGWKRVLVVSDPPHLRRLDLAWGHAFAGSTREYVLVAASTDWWHPEVWWNDPRAAKFVLREALGVAYYSIRVLSGF
jgi:hypothetical protein